MLGLGLSLANERAGTGGAAFDTIAYVDSGALGTGTLGDVSDPFPSYADAVTALNAEHSGSPVPVTIVFVQDIGISIDLDLFATGITNITFDGASQSANIVTAQSEVSWTLTLNTGFTGLDAPSASLSPGSITITGNASGVLSYTDGSGDNGAAGAAGANDDQSGVDGAHGDSGSPNGQAGTAAAAAIGGNGETGSVGFAGRALIFSGDITLNGVVQTGGGIGGYGGPGGAAYANGGDGGEAYDDGLGTPADGGNGGNAANATGGTGGNGANGGNGGNITVGANVVDGGATYFAGGGATGGGGLGGDAFCGGGSGGAPKNGGTGGTTGASGTATSGSAGNAGAASGNNGTITHL